MPALLHSAPLFGTAARLRSGRLDLAGYINELCDRIDAVDPVIQAMVPEPSRRERLLREAAALEERFPEPDSYEQILEDLQRGRTARQARNRPPLYGVPVGVKDIFRVDGFPTRAGSQLPPELFEGPEAPCVTRLREAGALILGKTVTTEFAYFEPGPTRNPHNPAHTPGGSSSGSAAAIAAGFCPLALGTQTVGSVIRPAAFCGIAGFKPTYGLISTQGILPFAPSVDHVGFFVQQAHDLALVLSVLTGEDEETAPGWRRLGIPAGPYLEQASPEAREAFEEQVACLERGGREILRIRVMENIEEINRRHQLIAAVEMAITHADWFPRYEALYRPRTAALIREGQANTGLDYVAALDGRAELRAELEAYMALSRVPACDGTDDWDLIQAKWSAGRGIQAWICPAAFGPAPEGLYSTGDPVMNRPWTHAGMPVATVPAGRAANGLPLGMQCIGRAGDDAWLVAFANQLSQELNAG
jgi:Asp-tRNA(Asn)/Glu-tRNA(Gln) amidotransferase A subunit family amidase